MSRNTRRIWSCAPLCGLLVLPLTGCQPKGPAPDAGDKKAEQKPAETDPKPEVGAAQARQSPEEIAKEVQSVMDTSVDPCDNFYQYACGGWLKNTKRPDDKPRYGRGFGEVADRNKEVLKRIFEQASQNTADPKALKLGTFYNTCIDEAAVEKAGVEPLKPLLAKVDAATDLPGWMKVLGELHGSTFSGGRALLRFHVTPDSKDPDTYIADVSQGGLGLPDRDFYLKDDDKSKDLRAKYEAHIATMLGLAGEDKAKAAEAAKNIVAFETELAKRSKPRAELRDPQATYNKLGYEGFVALDKNVPWDAYFTGLGYEGSAIGEHLNVSVPSFFKGLGDLLKKTELATLQAYLRWHTINATADYLTKAFVDADFEMQKALTGAEKLSPRWERCTDLTNYSLRELAGPLFVAEKFAGDNKKIALEMIAAIEGALEQGLPSLEWMDDKTRARAVEKMKAITNKIGYPDKWRDYSSLEVKDAFLANVLAAKEFNFRHHGDKIGQKVDRSEWYMPPAMVNAYYNPSANEIVFPAGILQPPYFSQDFPMAMNFGGIGMVMGHEVTHGFDDQGRKFDGKGVLREWWEPEVSKQFEERAACVDKTYSEIEVLPGVKLNGKLTLGENIADFGGIKEAFGAYKNWSKEHPSDKPFIEGLTDDQLFFLGFAQGWCTHSSEESIRLRAVTDPHSPPEQRVNVPLAHFPGFWETFECAEGKPMHVKDACEVW